MDAPVLLCKACGQTRSRDAFYANYRVCKECIKAKRRADQGQHRGIRSEESLKCAHCGQTQPGSCFRKRDRTCKTCRSEQKKRWHTAHRKHRLLQMRSRLYGMTTDELSELLSSGSCSICGAKEQLHIDHCHQTGAVRGLLCESCNWMLGNARDNPETLARGAEYLKVGAAVPSPPKL